MASSLPDRIDPRRLSRKGETLAGDLPADLFPRLGAVLASGDATVRVELRFGCLEGGIPSVEGVVTLAGTIQCQRCLEPMALWVAAEVQLAVLRAGERPPRESGYELLEIGESGLCITRLVEDELVLALPDYPVHPAFCQVMDAGSQEARGDAGDGGGAWSPFAVLASLEGLADGES